MCTIFILFLWGDIMGETLKLLLPISGTVIPLSEVNDYLFNKKMMGEGIAIKPKDNLVYSPIDGEVAVLYESKHALMIKGKSGINLLIHVGMNTAKLEGRGFGSFVKVGDKVLAGDKLMFFDTEYVENKSSLDTPVVITNPEILENIDIDFGVKKAKSVFATIKLK